ncbi:hypothetical protein BGX31_004476 [Mortierella sp. GBA43]|nr:hypothetical protein BGX31_004476 [Mortierella sp. GBA43]
MATVLLAHCQPRLLLEIVDDALQATGIQSQSRVTLEQPQALVATQDGGIWSIPILQTESGTAVSTPKRSTLRRTPSKVTIEIEDSDDDGQEIEEVELWNDEEGLLDTPEAQDLLSRAAKRQRTSSTPPPMLSSSKSNNNNNHASHKVNTEHYMGSEEDVTALVWALNGLLVLRRKKNPILWTFQHDLRPGAPVNKKVIMVEPPLLNASHGVPSSQLAHKAFVGAGSGAIHQVIGIGDTIGARKIHSLQEPVASLIMVPHPHIAQAESLLALGTLGGISWLDLQVSDDSLTAVTGSNMSTAEHIQNGFLANGYVYVRKADGRILRISASSLASERTLNWEYLDIPYLRAFVPTIQEAQVLGFYGINDEGRILRFPADLTRQRTNE